MELYNAAVNHDAKTVARLDPTISERIKLWRRDFSAHEIGILVKNAVLMKHTPDVNSEVLELNVCENWSGIVTKKPALVALYDELKKEYSEDKIRQALLRASKTKNEEIERMTRDVHTLILMCSNKDDRKKKKF
jgi:thiamine biosynthesis lipoprotein ApbE